MNGLSFDLTVNLPMIGAAVAAIYYAGRFSTKLIARLDQIGDIAHSVKIIDRRVKRLEDDCRVCDRRENEG